MPCSLYVAWVWCQTSDKHTISHTLGVKVFFSCCPTSSALLHFPISLSVALPLSVNLSLLHARLPSSFSLFSALCPLSLAFMILATKNRKIYILFCDIQTYLPLKLLLLFSVWKIVMCLQKFNSSVVSNISMCMVSLRECGKSF